MVPVFWTDILYAYRKMDPWYMFFSCTFLYRGVLKMLCFGVTETCYFLRHIIFFQRVGYRKGGEEGVILQWGNLTDAI